MNLIVRRIADTRAPYSVAHLRLALRFRRGDVVGLFKIGETANAVRQCGLDGDPLNHAQRIFQLNTKVAHCAIHPQSPMQKLSSGSVARSAVDLRSLGPAECIGAIGARLQPDCYPPILAPPTVLPRLSGVAVQRKHRPFVRASANPNRPGINLLTHVGMYVCRINGWFARYASTSLQ